MEKKFESIYGSKYMISVNDTILLPVFLENLPNEICINNNKLYLKSHFHVSLICVKEIIRKNNILIIDFKNLIVNDFKDKLTIFLTDLKDIKNLTKPILNPIGNQLN
ncbi:MAG: hypothetical protein WC884_02770 [Candidatus Paceibacterota bacterium]